MSIKEQLEIKEKELKTKVTEFNINIQKIQQLNKQQETLAQDILRLDGAVQALKSIDNNE